MRCIRGPPCCAIQGNTQTVRPTVLSRRTCVWTAHAALATMTLQFAQSGAARPVPDQSVAQRCVSLSASLTLTVDSDRGSPSGPLRSVYDETRSSIVGIADFRVRSRHQLGGKCLQQGRC
jgi:hypothetical protein